MSLALLQLKVERRYIRSAVLTVFILLSIASCEVTGLTLNSEETSQKLKLNKKDLREAEDDEKKEEEEVLRIVWKPERVESIEEQLIAFTFIPDGSGTAMTFEQYFAHCGEEWFQRMVREKVLGEMKGPFLVTFSPVNVKEFATTTVIIFLHSQTDAQVFVESGTRVYFPSKLKEKLSTLSTGTCYCETPKGFFICSDRSAKEAEPSKFLSDVYALYSSSSPEAQKVADDCTGGMKNVPKILRNIGVIDEFFILLVRGRTFREFHFKGSFHLSHIFDHLNVPDVVIENDKMFKIVDGKKQQIEDVEVFRFVPKYFLIKSGLKEEFLQEREKVLKSFELGKLPV